MNIKCDVHTHTFYSRHAYSTIEENICAAKEIGLELLGSTDHFSGMLFPEPLDLKNYQYFSNVGAWPREWHGVKLLRGCESDIIDLKGNLFGHDFYFDKTIVSDPYTGGKDLDKFVTDRMDYVIASVHGKGFTIGASKKETTEMYLGALEHPKVLILGHTGRSGVPYDVDEVLIRAKELGKAIEINEHSFEIDGGQSSGVCKKIAIRCAELGTKIAVSTDAHISVDIGRFNNTVTMLEEIHFPEELIANRNAEVFLETIKNAKLG
ncbi:putative hydrolase [Lachnospiraceae bacterium KH1T2]|nr:putative hydrolase [Lachnospiraceae bacterium KH1T2]